MTTKKGTTHWWHIGMASFLLFVFLAAGTTMHAGDDTTPPQVDPGCADGCPPLTAEVGQPKTFSFGYSDDVGVTSCTLYVDSDDKGLMTLSAPGGTLGFASKDHTFTTLGDHTVGVTCKDAAGNEGGGKVARDVDVVDTTPPQVDPGCANGCPALTAEVGQPKTFSFGYSDYVGVTSCTLYVDSVDKGLMTLSAPGGTLGFASKDHTFATPGDYTVGVTCQDAAGNVGGGKVARDVSVSDTTPPETAVTSAVDDNGDQVVNGGSTVSDGIAFTFTGTDFVGISGFECSLDGATFASCTSPKAYTSLAAGSHSFAVRAIDTSSNIDPTPATFTWTVLAPEQAIQNLIDRVKALQLQKGIGNSFDAILNAALQALQDANQDNDVATINALNAFINAVEAQRGKYLTDAEADELIGAARAIIGSLSGP